MLYGLTKLYSSVKSKLTDFIQILYNFFAIIFCMNKEFEKIRNKYIDASCKGNLT
ncbi:MAG: hypothetical protein JNL70_21665 [Saprospiraceae bacterium]|nr:hypothetical protein [Saprospiraceae bacterium]